MSNLPQFTGTQVNYYLICHRKLWLFSHGVQMERENENVQAGKLIGESSYKREQKEVKIDDRIVLDWVETKVLSDGSLVLHETKKSRAFDNAHRLQVLYYLFYLQCKGVAAQGEIDYPLLKQTQRVQLTPETQNEVEQVLEGVADVVSREQAPERLTNRRVCEACAYFELCWS